MGIFKCDKHDFTTDEPKEWRDHNSTFEHVTRGVAPCNQCSISTSFVFTGKVGGNPPALCDACKKKLLEGNEK